MARGGMGELFLAASGDTGGFEKPCVVKKVLATLDDQAVHRRFLDEAKVVVRLNHQNLVQVFDAGRVDKEYYLAMELVEGKDLRAVWNRCAQLHRRIPVDIALYVVREVLRGLDYVHDAMQLDLVHRDISPPNLLIGYRGEVKLTDFGLAKSAIKREMTSPGVVFGRYSYLSPEQARGLSADRRTDIYACGIVLWELLTGRQLFPSSNRTHQEALAAVRNPVVRSPSELVPGIPEGLDDLVLKSLRTEPEKRYSTAGEFRNALSEILARDFPACTTDRLSDFMTDIFAREHRMEARDYAELAQQDFAELRAQAEVSETISISDVIALETGGGKGSARHSTIPLMESDIVELDRPGERSQQPLNESNLRASAKSWVGRVVAQRYRIDDLIGVGGMGAVFRATHLALGKPFALKVLHSVYSRDADIITRFMREARAATQTGHPNIIDVLDIGTTEDGDVYFVMELLEAQNVRAVVRSSGPVAFRRAVNITRQICRALAAAHEVGIIHRDLKSENILLCTRGKETDFVKVLDFGICKQVNADGSTTSPGLVMGSPDYMAPEQGAGLDASVSCDVYAVGCILFEMLAGRLPFEGRNAIDVLMQKGAREAVRVTTFRPDAPDPLADVIARCLQRNPAFRPPSMRALEYELTRAMEGRATAVAAVLGLQGGEDPSGRDDPHPATSASFNRAAVAALDSPKPGQQPLYPAQDRTVVASSPGPAASRSMPHARMAAPASGAASAAKALMFVTLGVLLAGGALVAVRPELVDVLRGGAREEAPAPDAPAATKTELAPVEPAPDAKSTQAVAKTPGVETPPPPQPAVAPVPREATPPELVALAESALQAKRYREPAAESLAMAISKLSISEPQNPAIARLRKAAAAAILPGATEALERKRWSEAADGFRNLVAVWPDHTAALEGLVEALMHLARQQQRKNDNEAMLATADELVNLKPWEYGTLLVRADALFELGRWQESVDAYAAARREKPSSKEAYAGWLEANKQLRKAERKKAKTP
jgi:serine/threonine protein kinase